MKKEVNKDKVLRLINAGNVILVTSSYKGKDNIAACAWNTPCSHKPAALLIAFATSHFSSELITKSAEFIVNVPDWSLKDKVIFCGTHSGRDCDKFQEAKLNREKPHTLTKTPKIKECIGSIECSLIDVKKIGDHFIFFGEPLYTEAEENLFDFKNCVWKDEAGLIFHLGGSCFAKQGATEK